MSRSKLSVTRNDYPFISQREMKNFKIQNDIECAVRHGKIFMENVKKMEMKINKRRQKILQKHQPPLWFKNLSANQIAASNMITLSLFKIRDIIELNCIKHILTGLRLKPLPTDNQLIAAIKFAKCSDLAFLWCLYKNVYRTAEDIYTKKKFSNNERIIFSCICHLDMISTLRQLDEILPKPDKVYEKKIVYSAIETRLYGKSKFNIKIQHPVPELNIYDMYKNEYYVVANEQYRWFANERSFIPSKRDCMLQNILIDEITNMDTRNDYKSLCTQHASKVNEFLKNLQIEDENHSHLSDVEGKVACEINSELKNAERKLKENVEKMETQIINKTLVNNLIDTAYDQRFLHLCNKNVENFNQNQSQLKITKSSYDPSIVKYFHRPSINDSFKFEYEKIFSVDFLHDHGVVKNSINTALELNKYLTVDNAITACLRDMWHVEMREWNEKRQADIDERQRRVVVDCNEIGKDKEKIFNLLREGIKLMRKNSKFVLAALPYSYRLPILREWILQRYGVEFIYMD